MDVCTGTGAGQNATREYYLNRPAIFGRDDRGGAMALTAALEMHALHVAPGKETPHASHRRRRRRRGHWRPAARRRPTQPAGHPPPRPAAPARPASLQALLDAELPKIPARAGIWVKHLTTGEEGAVHADEVFNSASVIKIPVAVQALETGRHASGSIAGDAPDARRRATSAAARASSATTTPGCSRRIRDVLLQMIITSDNTATDLAIAQVGGVASVNAVAARRPATPTA